MKGLDTQQALAMSCSVCFIRKPHGRVATTVNIYLPH